MGPLPDVVDGRDGVGEIGAGSIFDEVVSLTGETVCHTSGVKGRLGSISLSLLLPPSVYAPGSIGRQRT